MRPIDIGNLAPSRSEWKLWRRSFVMCYALKGIDLEKIPSDRSFVRVANRDWKAASREHLIKNKIAVGRHQDLADVEKLRNSGSQADNS